MLFDTHLSHYFFSAPADARMRSAIGTAVALAFGLGRYGDQIVAVILTQGTARAVVLPEVAETAVVGLISRIFRLHFWFPPFCFADIVQEIKKERLSAPKSGANKRSM